MGATTKPWGGCVSSGADDDGTLGLTGRSWHGCASFGGDDDDDGPVGLQESLGKVVSIAVVVRMTPWSNTKVHPNPVLLHPPPQGSRLGRSNGNGMGGGRKKNDWEGVDD